MGFPQIIGLLSGVALFLFGMSLMGDGLKQVSGDKLEPILYKVSNKPWKGVLFGAGVTAVIQSSSATSVMVVGFVNSGMMKLRQAISVILGSIIGTSITGWVISLGYIEGSEGLASLLSTATLTGVVAVAGMVLRMRAKKRRTVQVGNILMGFAVLMMGMSTMSSAVGALGDQPWFTDAMSSISHPLVGMLIGAAFTALLQSASAAVGILQALSVTGAINFSEAMPLLFGITVGAALPVLLSSVGANVNGRRTARVYLVGSLMGVIITSVIFYAVNAIHPLSFMQWAANPISTAFVNTAMRLIMTLLVMPFTGLIEKLVIRMVPAGEEENIGAHLEERFIQHPALAIEQSRLTIHDMARLAESSVNAAQGLLWDFSDAGAEKVRKMEEQGDQYEDMLGTYMAKLTGRPMTEQQSKEVSEFLHVLSDFERLTDHARNLAENAEEINEKHVSFSQDAQDELRVITSAVSEVTGLAVKAFTQMDMNAARHVEPLEDVIDTLCDEMKHHHVERLQQGTCTILQGFIFNDMLTNFERISDHCSNVAVAVIGMDSGSFDSHEYLDHLKERHTFSYEQASEYYQKKYLLPPVEA